MDDRLPGLSTQAIHDQVGGPARALARWSSWFSPSGIRLVATSRGGTRTTAHEALEKLALLELRIERVVTLILCDSDSAPACTGQLLLVPSTLATPPQWAEEVIPGVAACVLDERRFLKCRCALR